ncbi:MAG: DUF5615 family PIN-like protein [Chloroflexi bacterium]|nr:DUF5615 family PIN-like protein [Chloroflexota bacterium]
MARLYSNENFPLPVVAELRQYGHDVLTIQETGKANQELPDDDVLRVATNDQRIVLTINRKDFIRLHRRNVEHAGIIVCTADSDFGQAQRIHQALQNNEPFDGQLIRVNRPLR